MWRRRLRRAGAKRRLRVVLDAQLDRLAILDEHLPVDTASCAWRKIDAIAANNYEMAEYDAKRIYRALMGLIPEHAGEVRAAFQQIL